MFRKTIISLAAASALAASAIAASAAGMSVTAFSTYQSKIEGFEAKIVTPMVTGARDKKFEANINTKLAENSAKLVSTYVSEVTKTRKEMAGQTVHLGWYSDFELKANNQNMLAFDVYVQNTAGSSDTTRTFYNIDKRRQKLITLPDYFKRGVDYVGPVSRYITGEMKKRNDSGSGRYWIKDSDSEKFVQIKPDQNFYVNDKGRLVICFDKYEVAPGASGSSEFEIPGSVTKELRR